MCVQDIDVQCVLQFTLVNAAGCALHRCTSRVIHRSELSFIPIHDLHQGRLAAARVLKLPYVPNCVRAGLPKDSGDLKGRMGSPDGSWRSPV